MTRPILVLAVLGTSPAVVTELLWHLLVREQRTLAGVEIWSTSTGAAPETLRPLWNQLATLAPNLPILPARIPKTPPGDAPFDGTPVRFVTFRGADNTELADIDDADATDRVAAALHDRVRVLGRSDDYELVGSLAGGRKTMSAALQTAFSFQAPAGARLVHVLLHPQVEKWVGKNPATYAAPTAEAEAATGIAVEDQVVVHPIRFPRLRALLAGKPDLLQTLDQADFEATWRALDQRVDRVELFSENERTGALVFYSGTTKLGQLRLGFERYRLLDVLNRTTDGCLSDRAHAELERLRARALRPPRTKASLDKVFRDLRKALENHVVARTVDGLLPVKTGTEWTIAFAPRLQHRTAAPATLRGRTRKSDP